MLSFFGKSRGPVFSTVDATSGGSGGISQGDDADEMNTINQGDRYGAIQAALGEAEKQNAGLFNSLIQDATTF